MSRNVLLVICALCLAACSGFRLELRPPKGGVELLQTQAGVEPALCYGAGLTVEAVATWRGQRVRLTGDADVRMCGALAGAAAPDGGLEVSWPDVTMQSPEAGLVLSERPEGSEHALCLTTGLHAEAVASWGGQRLRLTGDGTITLCAAVPAQMPSARHGAGDMEVSDGAPVVTSHRPGLHGVRVVTVGAVSARTPGV